MYINVQGKDVAAAREFYTKWAWFIHSFGEQKACFHVPFLLEKASRAFIVAQTSLHVHSMMRWTRSERASGAIFSKS